MDLFVKYDNYLKAFNKIQVILIILVLFYQLKEIISHVSLVPNKLELKSILNVECALLNSIPLQRNENIRTTHFVSDKCSLTLKRLNTSQPLSQLSVKTKLI